MAVATATICWLSLGAVTAQAQTDFDPTTPDELKGCIGTRTGSPSTATRFLAQLTATAFADEVDPERASVTGLSYGGGESWTQASQPRFDGFPGLKDVRLQVAVPRYARGCY